MRQEPMNDGIYSKLLSCNQRFLRDIALMYYGRTITFRAMLAQTERCACAFIRWGVKYGDSVLLCTAAVPEMVYALLALWKLGAVPHLLNPTVSKERLAHCISRSGASLFLVLDQLHPRVSDLTESDAQLRTIVISMSQSMPFLTRRVEGARLEVSPVDRDVPRLILWKEFMESGEAICASPLDSRTAEQIAAVVYPSQILGQKSCLTQGESCTMIDRCRQSGISWERRERFLDIVPPWNSMGVFACLLLPLCQGLTVILEPQYKADAFVSVLLKEKPHHVAGTESLWFSAIRQSQLVEADLSFLRSVYTGFQDDAQLKEKECALNNFLHAHHSCATLQKGDLLQVENCFFENMMERT